MRAIQSSSETSHDMEKSVYVHTDYVKVVETRIDPSFFHR